MKLLYVVSYFDDFTYDLVTGVGVSMAGKCSGRDAKVTVSIDQVQVTTTNA
jgi:hypothetical protein